MSNFSMNAASSYGPRTMSVSCSQTTNGSSANTSTINWTLSTQGTSSDALFFDTGPTSLDIAGANRYWKERVLWSSHAFPAAVGSVSGSFTLSHKDDGSIDPITVSLSTAIFYGEVKTASKTWTLDKIDRYFSSTPTISLSSRTETTLKYKWTTSETCTKVVVYYKKSNASSYSSSTVYNNSTGTTSSTFALSSLTANTTYDVYITATRKDSGLTSTSSTVNSTTYNYPYISAVGTTALTIGNSQTLTLYNPLGRTVTIKMYQTSTSGTLLYTSSTTTGTSITFTPTASNLYASIPSAQSSYCVYSAVCSSPSNTSTTSTSTYSYKIKGTEVPTFAASQVSTYDSTSSVTKITGQTAAGGWLVQSLSQLKVTINTAATALNSATISKYEVTFNSDKKTLSVGTTGGIWPTYNSSGTKSITITVTDSRGLTTTVYKDVVYKPYQAPSISLSGGRVNNYGENISLTATFTSVSVENKNGIKVSWSGTNGGSGYALDGNGAGIGSSSAFVTAYSGSGSITTTGDNSTAYSFTATITDRFGKTATATLPVSIGTPIMFIDEEQLGVGINAFPSGEGLYVKGTANIKGSAYVQNVLQARQFADFYSLGVRNPEQWFYLGDFNLSGQGSYITFKCYYGNGQSGNANQQTIFEITAMQGHYDGSNGTTNIGLTVNFLQNYMKGIVVQTYQTSTTAAKLYIYLPTAYNSMVYCVGGNYSSYTTKHTKLDAAPTVHKTATHYSRFLDAYPIGSIFISTAQSSNPASTYGGTWEQILDRFLYCTTSSAGTGGSNTSNQSHTHSKTVSASSSSTTTIDNAGGHGHDFSWGTSGDWSGWSSTVTSVGWYSTWNRSGGGICAVGDHSHSASTSTSTNVSLKISNQGSSNGNMPAYYTVYAWRRTA